MTERDNLERFGLPATETAQPETKSQTLNFVVPTEHVSLPSKGYFYLEGHPLHGKTDIEIKHMTAKEEDILTSKNLLKKGTAIDRMLESLIIDKRIKIDELVVGDKNALIIASRVTGYGPFYETNITCPQCAEKSNNTFNLQEILDKESEINTEGQTVNGTFKITLPKTQAVVEVRPLLGKDEKALKEMQDNKAKVKAPEQLATTQMKMFIVSVNDSKDRGQISMFIDNLPAADSRFLRNKYKEIMPDVDMKQGFSCTKCDFESDVEVPLTVEFFWPK